MTARACDVAIVGAGLSGLAATQRVERHGLTACIVEARGRIGGRVVASDALGAPYDGGGQFLHPNCTEMLAIAARHGLATAALPETGALIRSFGGDRQRIEDFSAMFGDAAATAAVFAALAELQEMMATLPPGAPWLAPRAAEWDAISFRDWAAARIADPVALAAFVMRPTFDMALGWDNISLLAVAAHMGAGGIEKAMGRVIKVVAGAAAIVAALAGEVRADIVLGAPVRAIRHDADGVTLTTDRGTVNARAAIIALSPALADRIAFTPALPRARTVLQRTWIERPSAKTLVRYTSAWWHAAGLSGGAVGDRPAAPIVMDGSVPGQSGGTLAVFSGCAAAAVDHDAVLRDLIHYFGDAAADPAAIVTHDWAAAHWSGGCGSAPPPGLLSRYGAALRAPVGPLFWAGAETADICTYNMEGAVTAGQRAGDEAAAHLLATITTTPADLIATA